MFSCVAVQYPLRDQICELKKKSAASFFACWSSYSAPLELKSKFCTSSDIFFYKSDNDFELLLSKILSGKIRYPSVVCA